jgi:hypothetical protein
MSSTRKYNSKGQVIEVLDIDEVQNLCKPQIETRGPFQSPRPVSPKKAEIITRNFEEREQEILAWCEAYLELKKRGISIYNF